MTQFTDLFQSIIKGKLLGFLFLLSLFFMFTGQTEAQIRRIFKGTVVNDHGNGIMGVEVTFKENNFNNLGVTYTGRSFVTTTDKDGNWEIVQWGREEVLIAGLKPSGSFVASAPEPWQTIQPSCIDFPAYDDLLINKTYVIQPFNVVGKTIIRGSTQGNYPNRRGIVLQINKIWNKKVIRTITATTNYRAGGDFGVIYGEFDIDAESYYDYSIVRAVKPGYTITLPNPATLYNVQGDTADFAALKMTPNSIRISGVTRHNGGAIGNVRMSLTGTYPDGSSFSTQTVYSNSSGWYSFSVPADGKYTITPDLSPYLFGPVSQTFSQPLEDVTQDFSTSINTYVISGYVRNDLVNINSGINDLNVGLSGPQNGFAITKNDALGKPGYYEFQVQPGTYTITPVSVGYTFSPSSVGPSLVGANLPNQNFKADTMGYTISGKIYNASQPVVMKLYDVTGGTSIEKQQVTASAPDYTYSFNVKGFRDYSVLPEQTNFSFSPNSLTVTKILENSINQDFSAKSGISTSSLVFDQTVTNRSNTKRVYIYNNSASEVRISNLTITGSGAENFSVNGFSVPTTIPAGGSLTIPISFIPKSAGLFNANLIIDHNDASAPNPRTVTLTGTGTATAANLNIPSELNFGTVSYLSGSVTKTFQVSNNSTVPGDILNIKSYTIDNNINGIYAMVTPFPIILEPGNIVDVTVKFNPTLLGLQNTNLHLLNSSNNPDAVVKLVGSVDQGNLIVTPTGVNFGYTSVAVPFVIDTVTIQNNSSSNVTINDKSLTGDIASFSFEKNQTPVILSPGQTDTVIVKFLPNTIGRKVVMMNISSTDTKTPNLYIPLLGFGGEYPVITTIPSEVNFGDIQNGQIKDTTITIRNDGNLDLNITSNLFTGEAKQLFSFVNDGSPITLRHSESAKVVIRIKADIPVGVRNAQLQIESNDPNHPVSGVALSATIKTAVLTVQDKLEFDSIGIGYSIVKDILIKNEGNLSATIKGLSIDGAYASDFLALNSDIPSEIKANSSFTVKLKFSPLEIGLRYSRLVISSNDPVNSALPVILKGVGKSATPEILLTNTEGNSIGDGLDFGTVLIKETKSSELKIKNISKFAKLRIDSIFLTDITDQPFSFSKTDIPCLLQPGELKELSLAFSPKGISRSYTGYVNIKYSDSTVSSKNGMLLSAKLKGYVVFPGSMIELPPTLVFGKVLKDQLKTVSFTIKNRGEGALKIDSALFSGSDTAEFKLLSPLLPLTINSDNNIDFQIGFTPKKSGTKDVKLAIYWNDVLNDGIVNISAEGYLNGNQTTDVVSLHGIPSAFSLEQNYPNPFNPSTKIEYSIPENSFVAIKIYNNVGQLIETLVNKNQSVGSYRIEWKADKIPTGLYFYKMETGKFISVKKMLLVK